MRTLGRLLMGLGTVLVIAALSLFAYNKYEDYCAALNSEEVVSSLRELIIYNEEHMPYSASGDNGDIYTAEIMGDEYIGYLALPKLELELPVMYEWSYPALKKSPCRYSGSVRGKDLVIMAHNYSRHFGRIKTLSPGDTVYFIENTGMAWQYEVVLTEILAPTDIDLMTDAGYDLTLFTCTYGGQSRVAVRCQFAGE